MNWDMFLGIFTSDNGRSKNRVGRGEARGNGQTREEVEFGDKGINEASGNEPPLRE